MTTRPWGKAGRLRPLLKRHPVMVCSECRNEWHGDTPCPSKSTWVSLDERLPGEHHPFILVTNNLSARTSFGNMSHLWKVMMVHRHQDGEFVAYTDDDRLISNLTHWRPAIPEEWGKEDASMQPGTVEGTSTEEKPG